MTEKELSKLYKDYYTANATTGLTEIYMLPPDVILNTRRAWNTSSTTVDGYSTTLGAPTGRTLRRRTRPAAFRSGRATARRAASSCWRRGSSGSISA